MTKMKRFRRLIWWTIKSMLIVAFIALLAATMINIVIVKKSTPYIYTDIGDIPKKQVIIVLGAAVHGDKLSLVLKDRLAAGLELYSEDIAEKILLSGDHGQIDYDEVNTMRRYILDDGSIDEEDIFLDHAGFDTYDSMIRALKVFDVQSAVIVTQKFHINRAVYLARELGIDAVGYSVDQDKYRQVVQIKWHAREFLSRVKAFYDVAFHSNPKYLGDVIPITGDGRLSWDEFD